MGDNSARKFIPFGTNTKGKCVSLRVCELLGPSAILGEDPSISLNSSVSARNRLRTIAVERLNFRQRYPPCTSRRQNGHAASTCERCRLIFNPLSHQKHPAHRGFAGPRRGLHPSALPLRQSQACQGQSKVCDRPIRELIDTRRLATGRGKQLVHTLHIPPARLPENGHSPPELAPSRIVLRRYFGDNASGSQVAQNSSNLHLRGMYDEYCTQQMGEDCCICDGHLRVFRVRMMKEINIIRPEINIPDSIVLMWVTPSGIFPTKYVATRPDPPKSSRSKDNPK